MYDPEILLFTSSLEIAVRPVAPLFMGTLLLLGTAAKTKGGTPCAVLSLAVPFQSTRWTPGASQARQEKPVYESTAGGIQLYAQRGESKPCLCSTHHYLGKQQLGSSSPWWTFLAGELSRVLPYALTRGEAIFAPTAKVPS